MIEIHSVTVITDFTGVTLEKRETYQILCWLSQSRIHWTDSLEGVAVVVDRETHKVVEELDKGSTLS